MNPKVNFYFEKAKKWKLELELLRSIVLESGLQEELKWGCPCYTMPGESTSSNSKNANIALIHTFKNYCAVLFFKGALLKDQEKFLIRQTENVQAAMQLRFTNLDEIKEIRAVLKSYIREAIQIEKDGLKVQLKKSTELKLPEELAERFEKDNHFEVAFLALTPGRQRAYVLYFTSAKQSATRSARIEKYVSKILDGKGLNDE